MATRNPVVARPSTDPRWRTAVDQAIDEARQSIRGVETAITEKHGKALGPGRATISNVASDPTYGIDRYKAERIAAALGRPVGDLFQRPDGDALSTA